MNETRRVQQALDIIRSAAGLDPEQGAREMWLMCLLAVGGLSAMLWSVAIPSLPARWGVVPLCVLPGR